jgi:ABC-type nitrate/sulfonate/bicarbonate transport system permease component
MKSEIWAMTKSKSMFKKCFKMVMPVLIVMVCWQSVALLVTELRGVPFPAPWGTCARLSALISGQLLSDHTLYRHIMDSLIRWLTGFGCAAIIGIAYGLVAGWSKPVENTTYPILHMLQLIPGLAWIPVAILIFGIGETATIFMIAMTAFTPIAMNVFGGVKQLDTGYFRAALMMGANRRALFLQVLLPGSLPSILTGLRVGLGNGWRVLVAAEMIVGTGTGLGYSIIQARWTLDYTSAFACMVVICIIGLLCEQLVFNPLEKRTVLRWALNRDPS